MNVEQTANGWEYKVEINGKSYSFKSAGSKQELLATLDKECPTTGIWRQLTNTETSALVSQIEDAWDNY